MKLSKLFATVTAAAFIAFFGLASANAANNTTQTQTYHAGAGVSVSPAEQTRLAYSAAGILRGQMTVEQDQRIPQTIVNHAKCILVFPGIFKAGLIVAGSHGDGIVSCRDDSGDWGAPAFFNLSAGSVGFQAGAKVTQLVVLFMTNDALKELMNGDFKFGGTVGVAAGPLGLYADVHTLPADTLAYKLDQTGIFAGAEIKGTTITADQGATRGIYGPNASIKKVLKRVNDFPARLKVFDDVLEKYAPSEKFVSKELQTK